MLRKSRLREKEIYKGFVLSTHQKQLQDVLFVIIIIIIIIIIINIIS